MKVKKILMVLISTCVLSGAVMAQNGFEFGISIPVGASIGFANQEWKSEVPKDAKDEATYKSAAAFEWGVSLQPGYRIGLNDTMSLSILLDLGYKRDIFAFNLNNEKLYAGYDNDANEEILKEKKTYNTFQFESIQLGLYPKFNIGKFAIGIGGGVKIPLVGYKTTQDLEQDDETREYKDSLETGMEASTKKELKDVYKSSIIGYAKISGDYAFDLSEKTALTVGLYLGYDFPYSFKTDEKSEYYESLSKYSLAAFDVGLQFGLKFAQ